MSRLKGRSICHCLVLFLSVSAVLRADTVTVIDVKDPVRGEITKESIRGIAINQGGATRNIARSQIAADGITYDNEPAQMRDAREALKDRQFTRAHRSFQAVIDLCRAAAGGGDAKVGAKGAKKAPKAGAKGAGAIRPIFLQHALWGQVQAYQEEGNMAGALAAIDDLLESHSDSWYLQEALVRKVRITMETGGEAAKVADEAVKLAEAAGAGAEVGDYIKLLQAEGLVKQGKRDEAVKIFSGLTRSPVKSVSERAKLAIAQEQLAKGELVPAKMAFMELLRSKDRATLCGAACGQGDALMKEMGADRKTVEGLREALENYLHAVVKYFPAQVDPKEPYQEAILSAAQCAEALMKLSAKNQKAQEGFRTLARDLYRDIQTYFPGSEAAKKAATAITKLASPGAVN